MLALRTARLHSRVPKSNLVCPFGSERVFLACHLNCIFPRSQLHLNGQQYRQYLFLPVSWDEARERLKRWLEKSESLIVKVSLLRRNRLQRRRRKSKTISKKQRLYSEHRPRSSFSLPLPTRRPSLSSLKSVEIRNVYQKWKTLRKSQYQLWKDTREEQYRGWRSRGQAQYQGWKFRRQAQYHGWKARREAQYQRWNTKQNQEWIKRRQVILEEYSKSEWFDELGRPLTARDSTGRFVNPWQSQSTNGIIPLPVLLRWRWQRFVREQMSFFSKSMFPQIQLDEIDSSRASSPLLTQTIPPLPIPKKSNLHFTWIGHATCLFQVENTFTILADPIFSTRASPFKNFIGVPRDVPPAFSIQELIKHYARKTVFDDTDGSEREQNCDNENLDLSSSSSSSSSSSPEFIDVCVISHDHYDHACQNSIQEKLKDHVQLWVVPLGISDWLVESCSIDRKRIVELRWWEQLLVGKTKGRIVALKSKKYDDNIAFGDDCTNEEALTITCCPSSHWAGRTLWDRNKVRTRIINLVVQEIVLIESTFLTLESRLALVVLLCFFNEVIQVFPLWGFRLP